jgi:hypothetical protein
LSERIDLLGDERVLGVFDMSSSSVYPKCLIMEPSEPSRVSAGVMEEDIMPMSVSALDLGVIMPGLTGISS